MKTESIQGRKGDCILHALKNSGAVGTYKEAINLNIKFQKAWASLGNLSHKRFKELFKDSFDGDYFCFGHTFFPFVFTELNLKITEYPTIKKVKHLPKNFTGIIVVEFKEDEHHAVGCRKGHVFDSHHRESKLLHKYRQQKLIRSFHFLN